MTKRQKNDICDTLNEAWWILMCLKEKCEANEDITSKISKFQDQIIEWEESIFKE